MRPTLPAVFCLALFAVVTTMAVVPAPSLGVRGAFGGDVGPPSPAGIASAVPLEAARPAASGTLTSVGTSPTLSGFSWTKSTSLTFTSYELQSSSVGPTGPWSEVQNLTVASDNESWVSGMTPGATTWWEVTTWTEILVIYSPSVSNVVTVEQPTLGYLTATTPTPTSVSLNWTNNATYGGNVSFGSYVVYQSTAGAAASPIATVSDAATPTYTVDGLTSGTSYSFYVATTDVGSTAGTGHDFVTDTNTVNLGTPVALGAAANAQPGTADIGQTVSLGCIATGGTGPYNYSWTFGDGTDGFGAVVSHDYAAVSNFTANCTVVDGTHSTVVAATLVTVSPKDAVTAEVNHARAAPGTSLDFSAIASGGPGIYTGFLWSFGDGQSSTGASGSYAYPTAGEFVASVTVTDHNGETASGVVTVDISNITGAPTVNRTATLTGTGVGYNATGSGGAGGPYNYTWHFAGGLLGYGAATTHAYATAGNYSGSLVVADALGGTETYTLASVRVYANLTDQISLGASAPSKGEAIFLDAKVTGGSGPYVCRWQFGDGVTDSGCNVTHAWMVPGNYTVNVTVSDPVAGNLTTRTTVDVGTGQPTSGGITPAKHSGGSTPLWVWFVVAAVVLVAIVVGLFSYGRYRPRQKAPEPSTEKVCGYCGATLGSKALLCPKCGKAAKPPSMVTGHKVEH